MMTKSKAISLIIAAFFIILSSVVGTAQRRAEGAEDSADQLPGSWLAEITTAQGSFPGLITFTRDGSLITTESPGPFESPGHGNWVRRGQDVAYTFLALFGSQSGAGQNTGSLKVVGTFHRDQPSGGWSGPFRIEVFNPAGVLLFSNTGTIRLTRIAVEALD